MSRHVPTKSFITPSSGHKHAYIHHPPSNTQKATILFIHGFPSTSYDWRHQITHFKTKGYGILAPDCLGYGWSAKPLEVTEYVGTVMAKDIIEIMDHEAIIGEVVGIAHDWGTYLLSQLAIYYPNHFTKYVFLSVPFNTPGRITNIPHINTLSKAALGYEQFGYWLFLTSPRAGKIIGENWSRFFDLAYASDASIWKTDFAPIGAMERCITGDKHIQCGDWIEEGDKEFHHQMFGDDYEAPTKWYSRGILSLGAKNEKELLRKGLIMERLRKETLMVTGTRDAVCGAARARESMNASVQRGLLKVVDLDAGHWIMLERKEETNRVLEQFIEGVIGSGRGVKSSL